jgi:hypothetical protein
MTRTGGSYRKGIIRFSGAVLPGDSLSWRTGVNTKQLFNVSKTYFGWFAHLDGTEGAIEDEVRRVDLAAPDQTSHMDVKTGATDAYPAPCAQYHS